MIKPTVGRKVWIRGRVGSVDASQPEDGTIVFVHGDTLVNIAGYNGNGNPFILTSCLLVQGDELPAGTATYAEWMPFQKGQAQMQGKIEDVPNAGRPIA